MSAGAAVVSRVCREHNARRSKLARNPPRPPPQPDMTVQPKAKGCFLPCAKVPCTIMMVSMGVMVLGGYMCNLAFHADYYALEYTIVNNVTTNSTNQAMFKGLKSLTYIGPSFIGVGSFLIIICCVVLFDLREKKMKTLLQIKLESQQGLSMEYTNRLILDRAAEKQAEIEQGSKLADVTASLTKTAKQGTSPQHSVDSEGTAKISDPPKTPEIIPNSPQNTTGNPIPEYCEQINKISTISQPPTPAKIQMQSPSKLPPYINDCAAKDKWFPLMQLTKMAHDKGRILKKKRKRSQNDTAIPQQVGNIDPEAQSSLNDPPDYLQCVLDENQNESLLGPEKLQGEEGFPHVYINEITPSNSGHSMQSGPQQNPNGDFIL